MSLKNVKFWGASVGRSEYLVHGGSLIRANPKKMEAGCLQATRTAKKKGRPTVRATLRKFFELGLFPSSQIRSQCASLCMRSIFAITTAERTNVRWITTYQRSFESGIV